MNKIILIVCYSFSSFSLIAQTSKTSPSEKITKQFEGSWSLVAVENINADSTRSFPYGKDPVGLLIFADNGDYAIQILKAVRPKVAANDKNKATAEENLALVQSNNSHFGKYSVDANNHMITFNVEHAFYPNWEGVIQKRSYTLESNVLRYVVTQTTNGGATTAVVVWKRKP